MDGVSQRNDEGEPARADILVVDDQRSNLVAIEAALASLDARVTTAGSGEEALRRLLEREFALVILDVNMPSMDGFEVARTLRLRKRSRHVPIIFLTAYARDEREILEAYELGAVDFLLKPVAPEIVTAKARAFVGLARQKELIRRHEWREHQATLELQRKTWHEEVLQREMQQLAELDRRKDQFLAALGHELRNPLMPITVGLELQKQRIAQSPGIDPAIGRTRDALERQVQHLTRLVDDLLDVSRVNFGKLTLQKATMSIWDVVTQAIATSRPGIDERRHDLVLNAPDDPLLVQGDLVRLVQVVANLLNNAARYTPSGGRIVVSCARVGDEAEVRVEDNGQGISPNVLPRLFDAFVQDGQHRSGGLGLGLTIAHRLVALHGGTLSAHSEGVGRGSSFAIRLPVDLDAHLSSPSLPKADVSAGQSGRLAIVLVEDNPDVSESLRELLTGWGHTVEVAADGASGTELILRVHPNVAFIDIGLPDIDGYDVATQVRSSAGPAPLRLVALTGYGQPGDRRRATAAGFDAHLVKPPDIKCLQEALGDG